MTNESDRELLELAAKAAGIEIHNTGFISGPHLKGTTRSWNPLAYDGDAFRLMVKLSMVWNPVFLHNLALERFSNQDMRDSEAYRRAAVRTAAEIGRRMV